MANISREERLRREKEGTRTPEERDWAAEKNQAKRESRFGGAAMVGLEEEKAALNARDERPFNMRPGQTVDLETQKPFPDDREPPGNLLHAANQMTGRMYMGPEVSDPKFSQRVARGEGNFVDERDQLADQSGEEVHVLHNFMSPTQGRIPAGTVTRLPMAEAKKLVNLGKAKFLDTDNES